MCVEDIACNISVVFFETQCISRKRLKLETSNFASRLVTKGTNKKMQTWVKGGVKGSRDLPLKFWDSLSRERLNLFQLACKLTTSTHRRCWFRPPTRVIRGWSSNTVLQIQDGGRRHVGFSINANNFGVNRHTSTKPGGI